MKTTLKSLAAIAAAMLLASCATEAPTQAVGSDATVINRTGRPISSIAYQPCGAAPSSWTTLAVPAIAPQASVPFKLPEPCVNLRAHYPDGQIAGMHTGVKWNFPFTWILS